MRYPDKRPEWEKKREHDAIRANGLKTPSHTPSGAFFIDPDEIREQVIASRVQLKHLVQKPHRHSITALPEIHLQASARLWIRSIRMSEYEGSMTKVVRLIRHAQSTANAGQATTAPDTIPLTELGHRQAHTLAEKINTSPNLIVTSPFERAMNTAIPTAKRYPDVPFEIWPVEEFTYLSPSRLVGTTQAGRKPIVDAYWNDGDQTAIDGPGAESFIELLKRAKVMLDRLASSTADNILVFSHGQFIRAVAWFIRHGEDAGKPENMRLFREFDTKDPLPNCAGYDLELRDGRWGVLHQLGQDGEMKFIDEFCTDQRMAPVPPGVMTRERREILNGIRSAKDDFTE